MEFLKLAAKRHSVRKYKDAAVEPEKIDMILEAGRIAPTAANRQPIMIYAVQGKEG
ncbi:MAG: nitroreductase family protein, partial [Oscillospiraceae bacterium]|nr:nitroreductase family protein [Oscillospiraceae bacterium]